MIELNGVRKRYGTVEALRGVTANIAGKKVGLLGPNGAGKSTLIKVMLGLEPAEGQTLVLGIDPATRSFEVRDRVGYMTEGDSFLPRMNAVELCAYAGELSGLPRDAAMQRAHAALYYANLEDKRYQPVASYSTGQKQRVKLAQALVHDPEILFLDEPTNGLDPPAREEMLKLIDELPGRRGCSIILSTHILPDVERVCDQVVLLAAGVVQFQGTVEELRGASAGRYEVRAKEGGDKLIAALRERGCQVEESEERVTVVLPAGTDADLILAAAMAAGVQLRHMAPFTATLEDAFLKAVAE